MKKVFIVFISSLLTVTSIFTNLAAVFANSSEDLENVALKGTVEVSCVTNDNGHLRPGSKINDGDVSLGSYWDSGISAENPYVILDLQKEYQIEKIRLVNYWGKVYQQSYDRWYKYEIYGSTDKSSWNLIAKKDNETPSTKDGDVYELSSNKNMRYVKVVCLGGNNADPSLAHIVELEAFADTSDQIEKNIALNKPVSAAMGNTAAITDGNIRNYWDGGQGPQAFVIDLQDYYEISSFHAYPYFADGRKYEYDIYVSDNGFNYEKVASKNDGKSETAAGTVFTLDTPKIARYVKVNMIKNSANASVHMNEFEVMGSLVENYTPATPVDPSDPNNIAFGKSTSANSGVSVAKWAVDGDNETNWSASTFPANVDVDLGTNYDLEEIILHFPENKYYYYSVYTSLNGVDFERAAQKHSNEMSKQEGDLYNLSGKTARYVRVNVEFVSEGALSLLSEIRVHGKVNTTVPVESRENLSLPKYADSEYAKPITKDETIQEVYNLIGRVLGEEYKSWFDFELIDGDQDFYELSSNNNKVLIKGNKGVSLTSGLYYYLKNYCKVQITQQTSQISTMPKTPVVLNEVIRKETPFEVRYAYNYCTLSYTKPFYGEEEWQRELDWLALNGVNLVLDITGQEAVWVDFLQKLGYSTGEAESWLVGPSYIAWQFMSNMENYGGPMNDQYILDRLELARKNQRKMRVLGMDPVMQGYAGMIPSDYDDVITTKGAAQGEYKKYIDAMMPQGSWGGQFERPAMLKTNTEAFNSAAEMFYQSQKDVLGEISNYYAVDPFHEGGIRPSDMSESEISKTVLGKMMEADDKAVWVIQSWEGNPTKQLLDGLGEYRDEHALILDLTSTSQPHYNNSRWGEEFYGTPWVYCMLDNFGDRPGVHGDLQEVATGISEAYHSSSKMKGIGITPEGTKLNPINYELFFDTVWQDDQKPIELKTWLKDYLVQRYGKHSEAAYQGWLLLLETAYSGSGDHWGGPNGIINQRPGKNPILGSYSIPYDVRTFETAVKLVVEDYNSLSNQETYLYDVAALLKQVLQNSQYTYYRNFERAYQNNDLSAFESNSQKFLESISIMDRISATQSDELLGNWIGLANDRSANYDDFSKDAFEFNAKALITTWGGRQSARSLGDYAYRQYSGLLEDYIKPRWEKYIENKLNCLKNGEEYHEISYDTYFNDTWEFIFNGKDYTRNTSNAKEELKELSQLVVSEYFIGVNKVVLDDNIAINASVSSSNGASHALENINDNDTNTLWAAGNSSTPSSVVLNLLRSYPVYKIHIDFEKEPAAARDKFMSFYVEVEQDGQWNKVYTDSTSKEEQSFDILFDQVIDINKVRVVITSVASPLYPAVAEVKIYSSKGILVNENSELEIIDKEVNLKPNTTVNELLENIRAEVGEISIYDGETELNGTDIVKDGSEIVLMASGVEVDRVKVTVLDVKAQLQVLYDECLTLNETEYTQESWTEFKTAMDNAKAVLEKADATQEEVDNAVTLLQNAKEALVKAESTVSKTALTIAVEMAGSVTAEDLNKVVPAVVTEFNAALAEARVILADNNATQEEVDASFARLSVAMHMLEFLKGDTAELQALVDSTADLVEEKYTEESWSALQDALTEANAVLSNVNAMQEEVDEAYDNLADAIKGLVEAEVVDKTLLEAMVNKVLGLKEDKYIESTWSAMLPVLKEAQEVLGNDKAAQAEVDKAYDALTRAYLNLRLKPNKDLLSGLIDKANGLNSASYSANTWNVVADALDKAKAVLNNPEASEAEVKAAERALTKALEGLVTKPVEPVKAGDTTASVKTGDNGLTGIFAGLTMLSLAGYYVSKKKEN